MPRRKPKVGKPKPVQAVPAGESAADVSAQEVIQEYSYSVNDARLLTAALEALSYLIHYLNKEQHSAGCELMIKLNYQCLSNCFERLSLQSIKGDPGLRDHITWMRAGEGKNGQLFDRMDTSHETNFLRLLNIVGSKNIWLDESRSLHNLIVDRLSSITAAQRIKTGDNDGLAFNELKPLITNQLLSENIVHDETLDLDMNLFQSFQSVSKFDRFLGNIANAFNVLTSIYANDLTSIRRAVVFMAIQVIGNNVKKLYGMGYEFNDLEVTSKIRDLRNIIAHANNLCSLEKAYSYAKYVIPCKKLLSQIQVPAIVELVDNRPTAATYESDAEDEAKSDAVINYGENHRQLAKLADDAGLLDVSIDSLKVKENDRIFSDTDLLLFLMKCVKVNKFELFSLTLDSLELYTDTKANIFINIPIEYTAKKQVHADEHNDYVCVRYKQSATSPFVHHIEQKITKGTFSRYGNPAVLYVHLLEMAYRSYILIKNDIFAKLLDLGAKTDIEISTVHHLLQPLLHAAIIDHLYDIADLLLSYGADVNIRSADGMTALVHILNVANPIEEDVSFMIKRSDPREIINLHTMGVKANILSLIMVATNPEAIKDDDATLKWAKIIVKLTAEEYGIDAVKDLLQTPMVIRSEKSHITPLPPIKRLSRERHVMRLVSRYAKTLDSNIGSLTLDSYLTKPATKKEACVRFIYVLKALLSSDSNDIFKIALEKDLNAVEDLFRQKNLNEQLTMLSEDLLYTKPFYKEKSTSLVDAYMAFPEFLALFYGMNTALDFGRRIKELEKESILFCTGRYDPAQVQRLQYFCTGRHDPGQVQRLHYTEIPNILGFEYMPVHQLANSFWGCVNYMSTSSNNPLIRESAKAKFTVLDDSWRKLAVHKPCNAMGYGLVATDPIAANTVILEFTGDIGKLSDLEEDNIYKMSLDKEQSIDGLWISAKNRGGLARFACHLPNEQPQNLGFNAVLATLNCYPLNGPDRVHVFLITKKNIQPGTELGWDYGPGYQFGAQGPVFCDEKTGKFHRRMAQARQGAKKLEDEKESDKPVSGVHNTNTGNRAQAVTNAPTSVPTASPILIRTSISTASPTLVPTNAPTALPNGEIGAVQEEAHIPNKLQFEHNYNEESEAPSFSIKNWLFDAVNDIKCALGYGQHQELQELADKYETGIRIKSQSDARKAFRKIALKTHPDKVFGLKNDYEKAEKLSTTNHELESKLAIYRPIMSNLNTAHQAIRIIHLGQHLRQDIKEAIENPLSINTISKLAFHGGCIAEIFFQKNLGTQYAALINLAQHIAQQIDQGEYESVIKSSALLAFYMSPGLVMPVAPALAVTLKIGILVYDGHNIALDSLNTLAGAYTSYGDSNSISETPELLLAG